MYIKVIASTYSHITPLPFGVASTITPPMIGEMVPISYIGCIYRVYRVYRGCLWGVLEVC